MPSEVETVLHTCPKCGALLDVSEQEPFSEINCPSCDTSMRVRTRFDHFELLEFIASGGMGTVYKARDVNLNRILALKLLRKEFSADAEYIEKLETEAKITASVAHPNVVEVFSFGCDRSVYYIAMELVDKGSLDDLMNLQQRIAEAQVLEIGSQVAQGLRAAYQAGLIHRDVKPGNILFADAHTAKIVDFGLAMPLEQAQEGEADIWGTPYYVAPEKLNHDPEDFRSDIYSLGGTLFHALAGRPPFEAENASLVALKHLKNQAVSLQAFAPDISSPTAYVINRTLAKNPGDRYQSYDELIEHLEYARSQLLENAGSARQPKTRVVMEDEKQQNVMGYIMMSMLAFTLILGLILYLYRDSIFSRNASVEELARQQMERSSNSSEQMLGNARKEIIKGNFDEAVKLLISLGNRPNLTEPLKTWIVLHHCIAKLLQGDFLSASAIVARYDGGVPGKDMADDGQRRLFSAALKGLMGIRENTFLVASSAETYEPAGCLIAGLKEWDASRFEIADNFFQRFMAAKPKGGWVWLNDFKPLVAQYRADYDSFRALDELIKSAKTPENRAAILPRIPGVKAKLKLTGRLPEALAVYEKSLQPDLQPAADSGVQRGTVPLPVLYARVMKALSEMMPAQAMQLIADTPVAGSDETGKQALLRKVKFVDDFKKNLINELPRSTVGSRWIARRSGPWLVGTISRADDAQIQVRVDGREVSVPWSDVMPSTVLVWADSGSNPNKLWYGGVYACVAGYSKEGLARLKKAVELRPDRRADFSVFESGR